MMPRSLERLSRMDATEVGWRLRTWGRAAFDRTAVHVSAPRWRREDLSRALAPLADLGPARTALAGCDWPEAHRLLSRHFFRTRQRFAIGPAMKDALSARIRRGFPASAEQAATRAEQILVGEYDLLGYERLRFMAAPPSEPQAVDWHLDPVHQRRAPRTFWSTVPYLEPRCGDHKIIWELNRHQHWLVLGRAFWLTGEPRYRRHFTTELASWLDANPPLIGINWASMLELAFRSISWLWALAFFAEEPAEAEAPWTVDLLLALDRQLTQIERNLSSYFSPNTHLLGEALALFVAGCALPELAASARRRDLGRRLLLEEIPRQITSDGGHAERSTHYHRYTLDFYTLAVIVARINGDPAAGEFERAVSRLATAARLLADDRGRLPHIGDDDGGMLMPMTGRAPDDLRDSLAVAAALVDRPDLRIGRLPEEALWLLSHDTCAGGAALEDGPPRAPVPSSALAETGYYVSRTAASDHLVIDGGPHGYQNGGHAHADALSLTFAAGAVPLLIDPGTGCYTTDPAQRDRFRSSLLHNTVTVDDRPQSVASGPFHWAHTAHSAVRRWQTHARFDYFDGTHDGYRPLVHRRRVLSLHGDLLVVADLVEGDGVHAMAAHWHLDPRWTIELDGRRAICTRTGARVGLTVSDGAIECFQADAVTGLGWHSPAYGRIEPSTTLRVGRRGTAPLALVSVFDLDPRNPVIEVNWLPVSAPAGAIAPAVAVRIVRARADDYLLLADATAASAAGQPAASATRAICRAGEIETDARLLFARVDPAGAVSQVAMVDGSMIRTAGRLGIQLDLQTIVPDYFAEAGAEDQGRTQDQGRTKDQAPRTKDQTCVASPVS
jgi:hypothetical protein